MSFPAPDEPDKLYQELAAKWLDGSISEDEKILFLKWYNDGQENPVTVPETFASNREALRGRMLQHIQANMHPVGKVKKMPARLIAFAAAVFLLAIATGIYYFIKDRKPLDNSLGKLAVPNNALPDNTVQLTLGDGSTIALDQAANGKIAVQGGVGIIKSAGERIEYLAEGATGAGKHVLYNSIRIPKGGRYQVVLPDHSTVWLNATSTLRFPTAFTGGKRQVELTGEGYFEVAKNKKSPFIVRVNNMEVAVLGTHFNIMAYNEEDAVHTTLLEGSVEVSQGIARTRIEPGEQAQWNKKMNSLQVTSDINLEQVMAWKNGEFRFENAPVEAIMRQIARWYDIRVAYSKSFPQIALTGSISRNNTIQQLLEILEATHRVQFEQQGDIITVEAAK